MGISGVYSLASTFYKPGSTDEIGAQIDLVLDRKDHVINLFEIKFYDQVYSLNKAAAKNLREKMAVFRAVTQTKKQLFWTLITTFEVRQNAYSLDIIDSVLNMEVLFQDDM